MEQKEKVQELLRKTEEIFKSGEVVEFISKAMIIRLTNDSRPIEKWSLHNQILCLMQGTSDARGYRQWETVGRNVKKGSKAIHILAPTIVDKKDDQGNKTDEKILVGFHTIPVFRVEDTEGTPLPEYTPNELPPLWNVAERAGIKVQYSAFGSDCYGWYSPGTQKIMLFTHEHSTFFHELAHAIHYRINLGQKRTKEEKECVAEVSARIIASLYGEPGQIEQAKAYVSSYSGDLTYKVLVSMIGDIQKVLDEIFSLAESKPAATPIAA